MAEELAESDKEYLQNATAESSVVIEFPHHHAGFLAQHYEINEELGCGAFATVFAAIPLQGTSKTPVAIKEIKRDEQMSEKRVIREAKLLRECAACHQIITFRELVIEPIFFYIITEQAMGGDLLTALVDSYGGDPDYTTFDIAQVMKGLLDALVFLESKEIAHRDIKPENLVLRSQSSAIHSRNVVLVDFGLAARCKGGGRSLSGAVGSPDFAAPEILKDEQYSSKADMWSCGVLAFLLLSGTPPFQGNTEVELARRVRRGKFALKREDWFDASADSIAFVTSALVVEPAARPKASVLVQEHTGWLGTSNKSSLRDSARRLQYWWQRRKRQEDDRLEHVARGSGGGLQLPSALLRASPADSRLTDIFAESTTSAMSLTEKLTAAKPRSRRVAASSRVSAAAGVAPSPNVGRQQHSRPPAPPPPTESYRSYRASSQFDSRWCFMPACAPMRRTQTEARVQKVMAFDE